MQILSAIKVSLSILTTSIFVQITLAQQVGIGTATPAPSAQLDVSSTSLGLLPPRMTAAQRNAIASPANGLIVFDTDSAALMLRSAGGWRRLTTTATPGGFWGTNDGHIFNLNTGKVGIGTTTPAARLHVADSSVLFSGLTTNTLTLGIAPPVEGPGIRMLWYPQKAAFRAGFAGFNTWDRDNIGTHSFAGGQATLAKGRSSTAFGLGTEAIGDFSTATGIFTKSQAFGSIAVGAYNNVGDNPNPVTAAPDDRIFQIGNGTADNARSNALTVLRNGNVGIGTITPQVPLQFAPTASGKKVSLYRGATGDAGFGVWPNEMRMHSDQSTTAITFGFDNLTNGFTERFRITPTGDLRMASDRQSIQFVSSSSAVNEPMMKMFEGGTQNPNRMVIAHSSGFKTWGLEYNDLNDQFNFKGSDIARISVNIATGMLGINDSLPQYSLDVKGRIRLQSAGNENNSAGIWLSRITDKQEQAFFGMRNDNSIGVFANAPLPFLSDWRLLLNTSTGYMSLGNFSANAPLHLNNDLQNRKIILYENANNDHQYYGFGVNGGTLRYQTEATSADHVFYAGVNTTTSNELFRIKGNGNVGVNQSNPQVPLHFATALGKKISLYRGPLGDAGFGVWGNELRIHSDYNGADITFGFDDFTNGFTERFRLRANGNATLAGVLTQNSDATLKKNIEPIDNASELLQQLHGYRYQWKDEDADADMQLGLLAQEVQKVLPELVKANEAGKLGVNYSGLIPVLLEALKEQQQKALGYEKQMKWLLEKAAEQERRLIELEKQLMNK